MRQMETKKKYQSVELKEVRKLEKIQLKIATIFLTKQYCSILTKKEGMHSQKCECKFRN